MVMCLDPTKDREKRLTDMNTTLSSIHYENERYGRGMRRSSPLVGAMLEANQTFARLVQKVIAYGEKGDTSLSKGGSDAVGDPDDGTLTQAAAKIEELEAESQEEDFVKIIRPFVSTIKTLIWVSGAALVFALVIGLLVSRCIVNQCAPW